MLLLKVLYRQENQLVDLRLVKKLANGQHQIFMPTYLQKFISLAGKIYLPARMVRDAVFRVLHKLHNRFKLAGFSLLGNMGW